MSTFLALGATGGPESWVRALAIASAVHVALLGLVVRFGLKLRIRAIDLAWVTVGTMLLLALAP